MKKAKVGDIFIVNWGWEQTNVNFYRIKTLRGKTQAVIEPVTMKKEVKSSSFMAEESVYDTSTAQLKDIDVFIKEPQKGKIVKFMDYYQNIPSFHIGEHLATPYKGEEVYESWYA